MRPLGIRQAAKPMSLTLNIDAGLIRMIDFCLYEAVVCSSARSLLNAHEPSRLCRCKVPGLIAGLQNTRLTADTI